MRRFFDEEENIFGPGTDLMMTLVGIVILLYANADKDRILSHEIKDKQQSTITRIDPNPEEYAPDSYTLNVDCISQNPTITVFNQGANQKFTFSDSLIFESGSTKMKGHFILKCIFDKIFDEEKLDYITDIQIIAHTDSDNLIGDSKRKYKDNITLGAMRSIKVYNFLDKHIPQITPYKYRISISTFGKYSPVGLVSDTVLNSEQLISDYNKSDSQKNKNRRLEIILRYNLK